MTSLSLVRAYALLRGVMGLAFCAFLVLAPDRMMPGSSAEPARSLALVFASRQVLFAVVLIALAVRRSRDGLAWLLLADAALQLFDTGMALAQQKGAVTLLPFAFGVIDVWAALVLRKSARSV